MEREFDPTKEPLRELRFGSSAGSVALENSNVPHPLPDIGNGSYGLHLVNLQSRRVLSDQAGVSEGGNGRHCSSTADHHITQPVCARSRWWLR
jgi:hypothetical protein